MAVVVLVAVAALVAFKIFEGQQTAATRTGDVRQRFARIDAALIAFVAANHRLPCPAHPEIPDTDATAGTEDTTGGTFTCAVSPGMVPWATIGLARNDSYDPWGWRISYHVFSGSSGSVTQGEGASMINCECDVNAAGAACELAPTLPTATGLCSTSTNPLTYSTTESLFLQAPRLTVYDFGTTGRTDVAYVLVSHGPTGLLAYTATGARRTDETPTNSAELNNATASGPFTAQTPSEGLPPTDVNFFDDVISYMPLGDLIHKAGLGARDWPESPPLTPTVGYTMNSSTVGIALGTGSASPGDLGTRRISFSGGTGGATVRGFEGGLRTDLAFNTTGGDDSLGVAGSGGITFLSSARNDKIRIDFNQDVYQLGVALADFGTSGTQVEQAQFVFSRGTTIGGTVTIVKQGCRADGGLATFSINPGIDFERVEITPLAASPSGTTEFGVADFQACGPGTGTCLSALAGLNTPCP